jgi:peptide chain release factor 1
MEFQKVARAAAELESTVTCYQEYLAAEQALADTQTFLKEEAAGEEEQGC